MSAFFRLTLFVIGIFLFGLVNKPASAQSPSNEIERLLNDVIRYEESGEFEAAAAAADEALHYLESAAGAPPDLKAMFRTRRGKVLSLSGKFDLAVQEFLAAEQLLAAQPAQFGPQLFIIRSNLAHMAHIRGDLETAENVYRRLDKISASSGPTEAARIKNNLAGVVSMRGDFGEARRLYQSAVTVLENAKARYGDNEFLHIGLATTLTGFGDLLRINGDQDEAYRVTERALQIREQFLPQSTYEIGLSHINLAVIAAESGKSEKMLSHFNSALTGLGAVLAPDHYVILSLRANAAEAFSLSGDTTRAYQVLAQPFSCDACMQSTSHNLAGSLHHAMGVTHLAAGKFEEAAVSFALAERLRADVGQETLSAIKSATGKGWAKFYAGDTAQAYEIALDVRMRLSKIRDYAEGYDPDSAYSVARDDVEYLLLEAGWRMGGV